jgi:hypothetical protein
MVTLEDIERALSSGEIENLDKETLERYAAVVPRTSSNPGYHFRIQQAQLQIGRAIDRINERQRIELEAVRHRELREQLEALKKPHWSAVPNFWMTLIILVLTAVGAVATVISILK